MKKTTLILAGAVLSFILPAIPTYADKCEDHGKSERFEREDREDTDCKPAHVKVPETNSFVLFATGLTALGGLAMLTRKKMANNKQ